MEKGEKDSPPLCLERQRIREEQLNILSSSSDSLRRSKIFTDVILICGDHQLPAHRVILAASSPYFHAMFVNHVMEKHSITIDLPGIAFETMERILEFVYTGNLNVSPDEMELVKTLLSAANQLQISGLIHFCCSILLKTLTVQNFSELWDLADKTKNTAMKQHVTNFIKEHFLEISEQKEFLFLSLDVLVLAIKEADTQMYNADSVVKAILNWIKWDATNRQSEIKTLFSYINFQGVSSEYLQHIIDEEPLVNDSMDLMKLIMKTLSARFLKAATSEDKSSSKETFSNANDMKNAEIQNKSSFLLFRKLFSEEGGLMKEYHLDPGKASSECGTYFKFPLLLNSAVCHHKGYIFFLGGTDTHSKVLNSVITFNIAESKFEMGQPLLEARFAGGAASMEDNIFVAGGISSNKCALDSVEKYSLSDGNWQKVACMTIKRARPILLSTYDRIYVASNIQETERRLFPVEYYNISCNQWTAIKMEECLINKFKQGGMCFLASNKDLIHILIQSSSGSLSLLNLNKGISEVECSSDLGILQQKIIYFTTVQENGNQIFVAVDITGNVQKYNLQKSCWEIIDKALENPNYVV